MKSIYEMLKPEVKDELKSSARKYDSAKRLKYVLMSKTIWQDLTAVSYTHLTLPTKA